MTRVAAGGIEEGELMVNVESRRAAAPPVALAATLGLVIVFAPWMVPGLTPPTM